MPVYEYKCKKCKKEFEITQRITEDALTECPEEGCDGEIYRKISKNIGLVFNGSGFYLTDYANRHGSSANSTPASKKNGSSKNGASKSTAPSEKVAS